MSKIAKLLYDKDLTDSCGGNISVRKLNDVWMTVRLIWTPRTLIQFPKVTFPVWLVLADRVPMCFKILDYIKVLGVRIERTSWLCWANRNR